MNTPSTLRCENASQPAATPLRSRAGNAGFTLIELLVAIAVAATLLTLGVPSFARLVHSARLTDATNALLSSMHLARNEAVKRGGRVTLCKSADGVTCSTSGGWEQGWIVFQDVNDDGVRDSTETVIERTQALASSLRAIGNSKVAKYVSFIASGGSRLAGGGFQAGTVTVCSYSGAGAEARQITLNAAGRPRVQKTGATECA